MNDENNRELCSLHIKKKLARPERFERPTLRFVV